MKNSTISKIILTTIYSVVLLSIYSCKKAEFDFPGKKEAPIEDKYLIFNSDSLNVFGKILGDPSDRVLYPNRPYKVLEGQRVLFYRRAPFNTVFFRITADVGKFNSFNPDNQNHYHLVNEYILIVK